MAESPDTSKKVSGVPPKAAPSEKPKEKTSTVKEEKAVKAEKKVAPPVPTGSITLLFEGAGLKDIKVEGFVPRGTLRRSMHRAQRAVAEHTALANKARLLAVAKKNKEAS